MVYIHFIKYKQKQRKNREDMTVYKLVVVIEEDNLEQAEDHILSLSGSDLLEHLQEEE